MPHTFAELIASLAARDDSNPWGITTAAKSLSGIEPCLQGDGLCPTKVFELADRGAWSKALKEAESLPIYENEGMTVVSDSVRDDSSIGKGFIAEMDCVLTTKDRDRDRDILDPMGFKIDSMMPLLWHHVSFQPIGRLVKVLSQDENEIQSRFGIVGTKLGHDALILVKGGCLRMSHGFTPEEFEPLEFAKGADGKDVVRGWHIKKGEIREGSLVSMPANAKTRVFNVVAKAYSDGEFMHPLTKAFGKQVFDSRPASIPVGIDLQVKVNGQDLANKDPDSGVSAGRFVWNPSTQRWKDSETKKFVSESIVEKSLAEAHPTNDAEPSPPDSLGERNRKALASLVTKDLYGVMEMQLPGSWEWVTEKLEDKAKGYLASKMDDMPEESYVRPVATFDDSMIVCVRSYGMQHNGRKCYQMGWMMGENGPQFDGDPTEVEVAPTVTSKVFADLETPEETFESLARKALAMGVTSGDLAGLRESEKSLGAAIEFLEEKRADRELEELFAN